VKQKPTKKSIDIHLLYCELISPKVIVAFFSTVLITN